MPRTRRLQKPKSLTAFALDRIRDGITRGVYALGSPLYEKVLADEFGVSKTPVREALVQLQREGLLVIQPHSGTFVFELADGEVAELCELRLILETNALQLAMRRQAGRLVAELGPLLDGMRQAIKRKQPSRYYAIDTLFHSAFFKHCGNAYLARSYAMIEAKLQTLRATLNAPLPELRMVSIEEHAQMLKALRESNVNEALRVLTEHIKRGRELMQRLHEAPPLNVETLSG